MPPNPVRTVPSIGVTLNPSDCLPGQEHEVVSIKMAEGHPVGYIERCHRCGWIDEASLAWWVEDAIKLSNSKRALRLAVAADTQPFAFVQSSTQDLTWQEVLYQALAAASMCWEHPDRAGEFNSSRAMEIGTALMAEMERFMRLGTVDSQDGDGA